MKHALYAATALVLMAAPAFAQTAGSNSSAVVTNGSQSTSGANVVGNPIGNGASSSLSGASARTQSRSNSSAQSGVATARTGASSARTGSSSATVTVNTGYEGYTGTGGTAGSAGTGDPSGTGTRSGTGTGDPSGYQGIGYSGGYTVRNVPEIVAPSIVGGNPCSVGVSGGVAVAGFGITGGGTWADRACERRQQAALLYNIGQQAPAVALLCQDENVKAAMAAAGSTCPGSIPVAQAPAAVAPAPAQAVPAATPAQPPAWCGTVTGASERAKYQAQCNFVPLMIEQPTKTRRQQHASNG